MDSLSDRSLLLYSGVVLVTVLLPTVRARSMAAAGLLLCALGIAADRVGAGGGSGGFATINEILIVAGTAVVGFAAVRAWRERGALSHPAVEGGSHVGPAVLLVAGLLFAAAGPDLIVVAAGIFLTLVSAAATVLRARRTRWMTLIFAGAALFGAGFFLLFTIVGSDGGRMSELAAGPFSPPAERLLAILLGLGSLALAGVFPFHRAPWRLMLSPLSAILLARLLLPALPEGLADWQAPAMLWLAVATGVDALSRRWPAAMVAGGLLGLWSGRTEATLPGAVLVLFGWLADARLMPPPQFAQRPARWAGVWFIAPAASVLFVLDASLKVQVLVSVAAVVTAVAALGMESRRRAREV